MFEDLEKRAVSWGTSMGINSPDNLNNQVLKLGEEYGELAGEILKDRKHLAFKECGDMLVVMCQVASQLDFKLTDALNNAVEKIERRKGQTIGGSFVKSEDL